MKPMTGAQFEISIDGMPRSYRDQKPIAIEAAEHLKRKHPHQCNRGEGFAERHSDLSEYKPDLR